jgi:hypothetical protein
MRRVAKNRGLTKNRGLVQNRAQRRRAAPRASSRYLSKHLLRARVTQAGLALAGYRKKLAGKQPRRSREQQRRGSVGSSAQELNRLHKPGPARRFDRGFGFGYDRRLRSRHGLKRRARRRWRWRSLLQTQQKARVARALGLSASNPGPGQARDLRRPGSGQRRRPPRQRPPRTRRLRRIRRFMTRQPQPRTKRLYRRARRWSRKLRGHYRVFFYLWKRRACVTPAGRGLLILAQATVA